MSGVLVYGAGPHGKVVADILICEGEEVRGFVDDRPELHGSTVMGLSVLGGFDWLAQRSQETAPCRIALGLGDNEARERIALACRARGIDWIRAIHPRATLSPRVVVGQGVVIMANAVVNLDAEIGEGAVINTSAVVEHDCRVGAFAHISPGAVLGGGARVGRLAHLGLGGVVLPWIAIGDGAVAGAGAVVVHDLPANIVARGVPARVARPRCAKPA
jgi:sugar O-acyltransferase (sialic acid O-acetyltransferase NeuD family)